MSVMSTVRASEICRDVASGRGGRLGLAFSVLIDVRVLLTDGSTGMESGDPASIVLSTGAFQEVKTGRDIRVKSVVVSEQRRKEETQDP